MSIVVQRFARNDSGSVAIEYATIAVVVGLAIIAAATNMGVTLSGVFTQLSNAFAA